MEQQQRQTLTFVGVDLLDPGQRVDFHQGVGNADDVHPVHDALEGEKTSLR